MFHCIAASIGVAFQNMTNNPDQKNVILLLTRPEGGNERFCLNIEHLLGQCEILDSPLQKIEFLETLIEVKEESILIFTSINGLRASEKYNLRNKKCFVVGENTRKIATSAGLSYAAQVDPVSGVQTPVVSQILYLFLIMIFLTVDGHLIALRIIIESYQLIPIGTLPVPSALIDGGMAASGSMFLNASIIMLPVVLVVLLINVAIGIITRSAPQLNLFSFGFPITMLGTFVVLYLSISNLGFAFSDLIDSMID